MCRTCGCGDVDEYDEDLEEIAADDPAWAYALAREDDLSVSEEDSDWQEQEPWDEQFTADDQDDEPDYGDGW